MQNSTRGFSNDIYLVAGVAGVLIMLLVPLPSFIIDLLVAWNFTLAVVVLLVTMYIHEAQNFSVFPTFLLIVTLLRLALGILLTRSLLLTASAGNIVKTFGEFVVGGNYVVGIIIFLVLVLIQFMVITGGAQRVAEVAARFTLDAMPGKQMSIDADLNAGLIDEVTAKQKRADIAKEADFYGSMDGATKFIRGDAIAAIIIIIVNIIGGFVVGVAQLGMTMIQALQTYILLTVGAGIALQVPALLISSSTGIIVTKASSESSLGVDISKQLFSQSRVMYISAGLSFVAAFIPRIPWLPFLVMSIFFSYLGYNIKKAEKKKEVQATNKEKSEKKDTPSPEKIVPSSKIDVMEMEIGYAIIPLVNPKQGGKLLESITKLRKKIASELGIIVPPIRIRDNISLKPNQYIIKIMGSDISVGDIIVDRFLAMNPGNVKEKIMGFETKEPTFGLPAIWINENDKDRAQVAGYTVVDAQSVMVTHLTEIIKNNAVELLGRQEVKILTDNVKEQYPAVIEELIPGQMNLGEVQKVLHNLLEERIPIRNLLTILESLADHSKSNKNIDSLTSYCRQALSRVITKLYQTSDGSVATITLDPVLEQQIADSIQYTDQGAYSSLQPMYIKSIFQNILTETENMVGLGYQPIVICSSSVRPHFRRLTVRSFPNLIVLSYNEILPTVEIKAIGVIKKPNEN